MTTSLRNPLLSPVYSRTHPFLAHPVTCFEYTDIIYRWNMVVQPMARDTAVPISTKSGIWVASVLQLAPVARYISIRRCHVCVNALSMPI